MREADLMMSRRRFLFTSVPAAAGLIIAGPAVFEYLDQLGPRRLLLPGVARPLVYSAETQASLATIWRKLQGKLMEGFNYTVPEMDWLQEPTGNLPLAHSHIATQIDTHRV